MIDEMQKLILSNEVRKRNELNEKIQ